MSDKTINDLALSFFLVVTIIIVVEGARDRGYYLWAIIFSFIPAYCLIASVTGNNKDKKD